MALSMALHSEALQVAIFSFRILNRRSGEDDIVPNVAFKTFASLFLPSLIVSIVFLLKKIFFNSARCIVFNVNSK